jgi:hypothetical protein
MFISAATEPGSPETPNEDWLGLSPTAAVVLDGVTVFPGATTGCRHGTPWYVNELGTRLVAGASNCDEPLTEVLADAIQDVASLHQDVCDLEEVGAPSAAVAMVRDGKQTLDYLVLSDVTILLDSISELRVITDDRVADTVRDLAESGNTGDEVMRRRAQYRNKSGGYWVAAADPSVARHAITGNIPIAGLRHAVLLTDGVTRLVDPFQELDWYGLLTAAVKFGSASVIERVRRTEAGDPLRHHWPRFKVSDDATIAIVAGV